MNQLSELKYITIKMDEIEYRSIELHMQDIGVLHTSQICVPTLNHTYTEAWISFCFRYLIIEIQKTNT
jgi:hypothetical protein